MNYILEIKAFYQDLLHFSGERICRINDMTLKRIREELAEDFDSGIGWKGVMERLKPIILDDTRAEFKTLDTDKGRQVQALIDSGLPIGFSNRFLGSTRKGRIGSKVVDVAKSLKFL